jgi:hypothetical protein
MNLNRSVHLCLAVTFTFKGNFAIYQTETESGYDHFSRGAYGRENAPY